MKTKYFIMVLAIGLFTLSTTQAQEKEQAKMKHVQMEKITYTCPMHAAVKSDKPGECPNCGMDLKKMKKSTIMMKHDSTKKNLNHDRMAKTYACSMHPEVTGNKPGECPKCGMALVEKKNTNNKTKSCC